MEGKRNGRTKGHQRLPYIHLDVVFSGGKESRTKVLQDDLFISSLFLHLGLVSGFALSKSLTPLWSLLLFFPDNSESFQQRETTVVWRSRKEGKPAAYEQSPPSAVFSLDFKIASCKERTTAMGSCHFYCLASVILTEDTKQYIRSKLKTSSYTICSGGSSHME